MRTRTFKLLLAGTMLGGVGIIANPAFAQDTGDTEGQNPPDTSSVPTVPETITEPEAQTAVSTSAEGEPIERSQDIIVTGSRIPQPNLESASPVTVVTSQEVKLSGTTRTEDLINSLPQAFAAQGSNVSNGASGTAEVSLRGLGSNRNLVLVNGKRLQAGDTLNPVPDLNFIPAALIKRVDILTGGASSVYGADAVSGVVNFILDTSYTGFRIDGQASVFNHHNRGESSIVTANENAGYLLPRGWSTNGGAIDIAGVFGAAFDDGRGHVTAYATYRTQDPILQSTRDYSFCALAGVPESQIPTTGTPFACAGSFTSATGTFLQYDPVFDDLTQSWVAGGFTDFWEVQGDEFVTGYTTFNFNPYNYFQRPDERYNLGAFADYEITPAFKPYAELMFMDDTTDALIAPSGNFGNTTFLACDNALLTDAQRERLCVSGPFGPKTTFVDSLNGMENVEQALVYVLRRNVEGGGRRDVLNHDAWRIVGGMRGDVARGISYDAYYQRGRTRRNEHYLNDFSITRLGRAIDAVAVLDGEIVAPGTPGAQIVCRAAFTGVDPNCVPWNIFQAGQVTPEALQYLQTPGFQRGRIDETIAHADVTFVGSEYGWRLPWAENGLGLNAGAEYRKEFLDFVVDEAMRTGDLAGGGGETPPVRGEFDVRELFAEVQIPIVENNFIDEFLVNAGYRFSNYHVAGNSFNTDTYKIAAELAPIPDIRFRGSYNRAVRAPNIVELFSPQQLGLAGTVDPCAGANPQATFAQCQLTGVTAAQYGAIAPNPAAQYNGQFAGNPNLSPEKADTWTLGVVLQPRFIPGLALTADYYNIKIENVIGIAAFASVFNNCFAGDLAECARIQRAPGTGSLWLSPNGFVRLPTQNFPDQALESKGWDFQGSYNRRLGGWGTLNLAFVGTLLKGSVGTGVGRPGSFAGLQPAPEWRHVARAGLTLPNGMGFSMRWRHFSGVECDASIDPETNAPVDPGCTDDTTGEILPGNARLSARDYFDLTFTARIAQKLNLRLGANNIFDRDPPVAGAEVVPAVFGNGNTFPQVYDSMGRYLFAGFTVDF